MISIFCQSIEHPLNAAPLAKGLYKVLLLLCVNNNMLNEHHSHEWSLWCRTLMRLKRKNMYLSLETVQQLDSEKYSISYC